MIGSLNKGSPIDFWSAVMVAGPIAAGVGMLTIGWLLGAFEDFQRINKAVTFAEAMMILGTMCFPFAAFYAARRHRDAVQARASAAWPTVPGKIERTGTRRTSGAYRTVFYELTLAYRYEVDGVPYTGDMAQFGPPRVTNRDFIEGLAEKYPVGKDVTVHYDPEAPEIAVLETSDEMAAQNAWVIWLLLGIPIVASMFTGWLNARP
jgi:hypothetical protein